MKVRAFAGFAGLGVVIAAAISALVWGLSLSSSGQAGAQTSTTHTVVYEAEGPGASGPRTASITLQTDGGGSSQQTGVALPLASKAGGKGLTFTRFHSGDFVYLSVQNSDAAGDVTCRILVDGTVVSENTSSGGYTIATCQATVR